MKNLLIDKKRKFIIALCCIVFFIGITGSGKVKAAKNGVLISEQDTVSFNNFLPVSDNITPSLPFIKDSLCFITDSTNSMSAFINELNDLLNGKDTVINIVHLGDSHIQAGFLSGRTMRLLQNSFGNAGRGWVAPFKLSKVNEPTDYFISSNIKEWIAGRCVQLRPKCPWGIGGIGIQTEAKDIGFNLIIAPNNGAGYSFNKIFMYRDYDAYPMVPLNADIDTAFTPGWGYQACENIVVDTFSMTHLVDTFSIKSVNSMAAKIQQDSLFTKKNKSSTYYGVMLSNSNPGILYHSIGVNGAKYKDYTSREYVRRLALLKPSLLIISLGTNESFGKNFSKTEFEMQINSFVHLVLEEMPGVTLLITTPAESYKRVYRDKKRYFERNENISKVADVISSYTKKEGIACWDLFSIAGGNNSCKKWFDARLFGRDRIHFSRNGYEEQGMLLYKAIVRSYISAQNSQFIATEQEEALDDETVAVSMDMLTSLTTGLVKQDAKTDIESEEEAGNVE